MILRLLPNERFSLNFENNLDIENSQFNDIQYIGFDGTNYYFVNSNSNTFMRLVFQDKSEKITYIETYNKNWQICSPFELNVTRLLDNVTFDVVNIYNELFLRYRSSGDQVIFENQTSDMLYRFVVGGKNVQFELVDKYGCNLISTYITDSRSRISFILKPGDRLFASFTSELYFRTEKSDLDG